MNRSESKWIYCLPDDILFLSQKINTAQEMTKAQLRREQNLVGQELKARLKTKADLDLILVSLTHSRQWVMGVSALRSQYKYLGLDCEEVLSLKRAQKLSSRILHPSEVQPPFLNFEKWASLIFCAKEASFKALPLEMQKKMGFKNFRVLAIEEKTQHLKVRVSLESSEFCVEWNGSWALLDNFAVCCVYQ